MGVMMVRHLDHPQSRVTRSDRGRVVLYNMLLLLMLLLLMLLLLMLLLLMLLLLMVVVVVKEVAVVVLLFCNRRDCDGRQRRRVSHRGRE